MPINSIELSEKNYKRLTKLKEKNDFHDKTWDEWIDYAFPEEDEKKYSDKIIENILVKNAYGQYFNEWINNFSLNLNEIWNGNSARDLTPKIIPDESSAIVIGRGPSIQKFNHLDLLAKSDFQGSIICTDGALISALKQGVTPDKFKNFFVVSIDSHDYISKYYDHDLILKYGNKIKCILSSTISPSTYQKAKNNKMEIYWLHTLFDYDKGKSSFNHISAIMVRSKNHKNGLPAIQTGGNVGTSCWVLGWSILKCSNIALIGIDHGFPKGTGLEEIGTAHPSCKTALNLDQNSKIFQKAFPTIYNPDFDCYCIQDPIFQYYSNALKEFIPKAAKYVKTINATEGGAIFGEGILSLSFKEFLRTYNY